MERMNESVESAGDAHSWTLSVEANAALVMLDRIDTTDSSDDERIEDVKRIIRRMASLCASAVQSPDGWKLVPIEPTRQMMSQGHFALGGTDRGKFRRIYQAMLAAAPEVGK